MALSLKDDKPPIKKEESIDYIINTLLQYEGTYNFYQLDSKKFNNSETKRGIIEELVNHKVIVKVYPDPNSLYYTTGPNWYNFVFKRFLRKVLSYLIENDSSKMHKVSNIFQELQINDPSGEWVKDIEEYLINKEMVFSILEDNSMKINPNGRNLLLNLKFSSEQQVNNTHHNTSHHYNFNESPNANIVANSQNVHIQITNYGEIKNKINELRNAVENSNEIDSQRKQDLRDCIDEVETNIDAGKKPRFSFKELMGQASNIAGVSSLAIELGKLIFSAATGTPNA